MDQTFTIVPQGSFSLRESVEFGFGQRHGERFDGVMRLAFVLDGGVDPVGVELTQDPSGVHGLVRGSGDVSAVRDQVARVLSLDHDGGEFEAVGQRDPIVGRLQEAAPGLRPPLFYSPYEAAVWSVLSARRQSRQAMQVRATLSEAHGTVFELAGRPLAALPTPAQLLEVDEFAGIEGPRLTRMHGVAEAALQGLLDVDRLREQGPDKAAIDLQTIKGIGPFYSSLVVIRAIGFTDVLPRGEPRVRALITQLYELPGPVTDDQLDQIATPWSPFRTWVAVIIRAATSRLSSADDTADNAQPTT